MIVTARPVMQGHVPIAYHFAQTNTELVKDIQTCHILIMNIGLYYYAKH